MRQFKLTKRFFKRFERVVDRLKLINPEYSDIKYHVLPRNDYFLVTLRGDEDLLKRYIDDLYNIPEMSENLEIL
jgi:hypothetical protein